jgi:hypothetical protein
MTGRQDVVTASCGTQSVIAAGVGDRGLYQSGGGQKKVSFGLTTSRGKLLL